jgi:hypothetical protein
MNENNTQSDHDALINVVRDVKNIKEGQDIFHSDQKQFRIEINAKLDKMIDNYVPRVDHDEVVRVQRVHDLEIKELQSFKDTLIGKLWGVGIMAGFGSGLLMMGIQYLINHK